MSARGQEEALQCSTKPAPIVTWAVRHATQPLKIAQRDAYTTIPLVTWGQHGPRTVGANGGTPVAREKKMILSKVDPGQLGMLRVGNLKKWGV